MKITFLIFSLCAVFYHAIAQKKYSLHVYAYVGDSNIAYGEMFTLKNSDTTIHGYIDIEGFLRIDGLKQQSFTLSTGYGYCKRIKRRFSLSNEDTTRVFIYLKEKRRKKIRVNYNHLCSGCIKKE